MTMNRRDCLTSLISVGAGLVVYGLTTATSAAQLADPLNRESVLRDPDAPTAVNPNGDVTIIEYFDYQCPYCKKVAPELAQVAKDDGRVRLVLKDWPIFGELSAQAAKLVLAANYQNKFYDAYTALMASTGRLSENKLLTTLGEAGVDLDKAGADLQTHQQKIDGLLLRNDAQARAFGFKGTPSFIVDTFRIPGVPTPAQFKQMIADVRAGKDKQ